MAGFRIKTNKTTKKYRGFIVEDGETNEKQKNVSCLHIQIAKPEETDFEQSLL